MLRNGSSELNWVFENGRPFFYCCKVILNLETRKKVDLEIEQEFFNIQKCFCDLEMFNVINKVKDMTNKGLCACVASLNFGKMVFTNHSIDKSSSEFWHTENGSILYYILYNSLFDWTDS